MYEDLLGSAAHQTHRHEQELQVASKLLDLQAEPSLIETRRIVDDFRTTARTLSRALQVV